MVHLVEFKIKFWHKYSKPGCQIQIMNTEEKKMALVHFKVDYRRWSIMMKTHFENVNINFLDSDTTDDFKQQWSKTITVSCRKQGQRISWCSKEVIPASESWCCHLLRFAPVFTTLGYNSFINIKIFFED